MEYFFIEYGKQDLLDDEVLVTILIPRRAHIRRFAVEKISKRYDQDISIVLAAMAEISGDKPSYRFAFCGMAGTPKLAPQTRQAAAALARCLARNQRATSNCMTHIPGTGQPAARHDGRPEQPVVVVRRDDYCAHVDALARDRSAVRHHRLPKALVCSGQCI